MAWSYSGDPRTSLRDEARFLTQDTDENLPLLSDAELDYLIGYWMPKHESIYLVAAEAAEAIAQKFVGLTSITADGVSVQVGDISSKYDNRAVRLRAAHNKAMETGGEVDLTNLMLDSSLDPSIAPLNFSVGDMDNPAAGLQARGGVVGPRWDYEDRTWR